MDVKGRNILLFGENGAGKSSIFWSIYTLFQAYFKDDAEASKYFDPSHSENLRNRYADPADPASIAVSFVDENGSEYILKDSLTENYNRTQELHDFMRASVITSDFLNYKQISKLFDFANSCDNDVFEIFEKEVFPILNLNFVLVDIAGNSRHTSNLAEWWRYINDYDTYLPHNVKRSRTFKKGEELKVFKKRLKSFNDGFRLLMEMIIAKANLILDEDFHIPVELLYEYEDVVFESKVVDGHRVEGISRPKLLIHAVMKGPAIKDNSVVRHPKSFFNEAKITCMGIALRLAILSQRAPVPSAASVIFIDDMLISLDMSLRMEIVPRILEFAEKWQLFIFTHDRGLFHIYQNKIEARTREVDLINEERELNGQPPVSLNPWLTYEIYSKISPAGIPKWIMGKKLSYLEMAKIHLDDLKIPECANALRRYCEQQMKRIVPESFHHQYLSDWNSRDKKDLNGMLDKFKEFVVNDCKIVALANFIHDIDAQRKLIMNPFSHDDVDTPFYRSELEKLIRDLPILEEFNKVQVYNDQDIRNKTYVISLSKTTDAGEVFEAEVEFKFLERFYKVNFRGNEYFSNPEVLVLNFDDAKITHITKDNVFTLRKVYARIHHYVAPGAIMYGPDIIATEVV